MDGYVRKSAGGKIEWELSLSDYLQAGQSIITRGININLILIIKIIPKIK